MKFTNSPRAAFTLAEVLITLGIIGIVAAMTLPTVVKKYKEKAVVTSLKKAYSVLQQAMLLAIAENGTLDGWGYTTYEYDDGNGGTAEIQTMDLDIIVKYMNLARDCGHEAKGCFAERYLMLNGSEERDFENLSYYRKVITQDGFLIAMHGYSSQPSGEIWVDVNGKKGPGVVGKDMFLFYVKDARVYPYGLQNEGQTFKEQTGSCNRKYSGYSCSLYVLTNENMSYL